MSACCAPATRRILSKSSDLKEFQVLRTVIDGCVVAERGKTQLEYAAAPVVNQFHSSRRTPEEFSAPGPTETGKNLRVIEAINGQIITGQLRAIPKIENGRVISDVGNDVLKIALVDRYSGGAPAIGFIKNFGLKQGAIASTVSHDSHNLLAVGVDDKSIAQAMNLLIDCQGGISAVGQLDGRVGRSRAAAADCRTNVACRREPCRAGILADRCAGEKTRHETCRRRT